MREIQDSPRNVFISYFHSAPPSFLEGMARLVDVCDILNQDDLSEITKLHSHIRDQRLAIPTGPEADAEAIRKVWVAVGKQLNDAIGNFEAEERDYLRPVGKNK